MRSSSEGRSRRPEPAKRARRQSASAAAVVAVSTSRPIWPVHAAAAMLIFSAGAALLFALRELSYHTLAASDALLHGGAAICAGVALGLWIPRQVIVRQLNRGVPPKTGGPVPGRSSITGGPVSDRSFPAVAATQPQRADDSPVAPPAAATSNAAFAQAPVADAAPDRTLISALFVAAGAALILLGLLSATMESLRAFLAGHFMFPACLTRAMLQAPAVLLLALASCLTTIALVALHGLHRAAGVPRARIGGLWAVIAVASVASALAALWIDGDFGCLAVALLPALAAGAIAALQQRREGDVPIAARHTPATYVAFDLLLTVTVASAAAAYACMPVVSAPRVRPMAPERLVLAAAIASLVGIAAGQTLGRRVRDSRPALTAALALVGVAWALPLDLTPLGPLLLLAVVTALCVACIVLATRRVSAACESAQYALSVVGACIAAGCAVAFLSAPLWNGALPPARLGALLSLGIMAVVGWLLMLDVRMPARVRGGGLVAVGLWLATIPLTAGAAGATSRTGEGAISQTAPLDAERSLLTSCGLRIAALRDPRGGTGSCQTDLEDGWQADLSHAAHDLLIVERPRSGSDPATARALDRRVLRRCANVLARGGRVAIERPNDPDARDAVALLAAAGTPHASAYLLRTSVGADRPAALLIGRDVPAWIDDARRRTDIPAELYHVENADALSVVLSSK